MLSDFCNFDCDSAKHIPTSRLFFDPKIYDERLYLLHTGITLLNTANTLELHNSFGTKTAISSCRHDKW